MRLPLDGVGSRQAISGHLTSHSFEEDDDSLRTFISIKINYITKDYDEVTVLEVHNTSMCRHVGAKKGNNSFVTPRANDLANQLVPQ